MQDDSTDVSCEDLVSGIGDERIRYTHNRPPLGTGRNPSRATASVAGNTFPP